MSRNVAAVHELMIRSVDRTLILWTINLMFSPYWYGLWFVDVFKQHWHYSYCCH